MKVREWLGTFISPRPSLFDLSIAGIFGITLLGNRFLQGMYFVFFCVFIVILTTFIKPKRNYISIPLSLLVLWSFVMVFVHNDIIIVEDSFMNNWFNISIMFEGFIYILFGILFLRSIVAYSTNPKFLLFLIPAAMIPTIEGSVYGGRMTIPAALFISVVIWLFLNRKILLASILTMALGITASSMWPWVMSKFECRPYVWTELSLRIKEHPFIGSGFDNTLNINNMIWVRKIGAIIYGWIYRHCDPLSLAAYLGAIVLIFLGWFFIEILFRAGKTYYLIPFLTIALVSIFQMTFFYPDKAAICLVIIGVCIRQTDKKGELA